MNATTTSTVSDCRSGKEWLCPSGICINLTSLCDGNNDCGDSADEDGCYVFFTWIISIVGVAGMVGNVLALITWSRLSFKTMIYTRYLCVLAAVNFGLLLLTQTVMCGPVIFPGLRHQILFAIFHAVGFPFQKVLIQSSALIMIAICFHEYTKACRKRNVLVLIFCQLEMVIRIVLLILIISTLTNIPYFLFHEYNLGTNKYELPLIKETEFARSYSGRMYALSMRVFFFAVFAASTLVLNFIILAQLQVTRRRREGTHGSVSKKEKEEMQVTTGLVYLTTSCALILGMPCFMEILIAVPANRKMKATSSEISRLFINMTEVLYASMPVIFYVKMKPFRRELEKILVR